LKALVKAFDKLHMVLAENSGYCGFEIQPMDIRQQTSGRFQLAINEGGVEDQLRRLVGDLRLPPRFNLALQWLEVPLNPVHADRERVNQVEALGVLGQDRREVPLESHAVLAIVVIVLPESQVTTTLAANPPGELCRPCDCGNHASQVASHNALEIGQQMTPGPDWCYLGYASASFKPQP
jgi:hypothetical protein